MLTLILCTEAKRRGGSSAARMYYRRQIQAQKHHFVKDLEAVRRLMITKETTGVNNARGAERRDGACSDRTEVLHGAQSLLTASTLFCSSYRIAMILRPQSLRVCHLAGTLPECYSPTEVSIGPMEICKIENRGSAKSLILGCQTMKKSLEQPEGVFIFPLQENFETATAYRQ